MKFKGKFRGTRGPTTTIDIDEQMPTISVTVSCTELTVGVYVLKQFQTVRHNKLQAMLFVKEKTYTIILYQRLERANELGIQQFNELMKIVKIK